MNTVPTTVATHDMNVARERDNSMNTVQLTVPIHERISPEYAILVGGQPVRISSMVSSVAYTFYARNLLTRVI